MDNVVITIKEVKSIAKKSFALMPTAIGIYLNNGDRYRFFNFVINRDEVYTVLTTQAQKLGIEIK